MLHEFIISGIILMGGMGCRFQDPLPKQFHKLSGKKVYIHTLDQFAQTNLFDEVILVCHPDWISTVQSEVKQYTKPKIRVIAGGTSRQESAHRGITASIGDYVVIHDAVRPFVSQRILRENIEGAIAFGAVDTCIPSADTIVHTKDGDAIAEIPNREEYMRGQTPQSFSRKLILAAHKSAPNAGSSCECRLVREQGIPVHVVQGEESNMKITSKIDLYIAEQLLRIKASSIVPKSLSTLKGKKIVVTGGTSGIGKALVEKLRELDVTPIIISRSSKEFPADLSIQKEIKRVFDQVHAKHGAVDGLINCVGLLKIGKTDFFSSDETSEMIATNFLATIESCKYCRLKSGGHIVNISSSSYYRGRPNYTLYSSMKSALVNFTQGYADERPELRINVIVPQRTSTPMRWANFPGEDPNTLLSPYKVADSIIELLTTSEVTGTILEVKKETPVTLKKETVTTK